MRWFTFKTYNQVKHGKQLREYMYIETIIHWHEPSYHRTYIILFALNEEKNTKLRSKREKTKKKSLQRHTRTQRPRYLYFNFVGFRVGCETKTREIENIPKYFGLSRTLHLMTSCKLISHTWDGCFGLIMLLDTYWPLLSRAHIMFQRKE